MTKDILETIVRMNHAASTDAMRYFLNGVHVVATTANDSKTTTWTIQATDGHALAKTVMVTKSQSTEWATHAKHVEGVKSGAITGTLIDNGEFIVPSDAMPRLKAFLKTFPKSMSGELPIKALDMGNKVIRLEALGEAVEFRAIDGEFPKTKQLFAGPETRPFKVAFNPELLMNLYKAMKADKRHTCVTMSFDPEGPLSSILVDCGESHGVLMPIRLPNVTKGGV